MDARRVRRLFRDAELAVVNHEMPTTPGWGFHGSGFTFSGTSGPDADLHARRHRLGLARQQPHQGLTAPTASRTRAASCAAHGLAFGGAGKDLEQARRISYLDEVGDAAWPSSRAWTWHPPIWAGPEVSGATPCKDRYIVKDIKRAGREADVVIVFPHWGVEYTRQPLPSMRKHAARWVKAGADLILGAHSHVAGAIEEIEGVPVLYSLGNLIFDQHWSTNTMESALLEATFHGPSASSASGCTRTSSMRRRSRTSSTPAAGEGRRLLQAVRKALGRLARLVEEPRRRAVGRRARSGQTRLAGRRPEREVQARHELGQLLQVGA